MSSRRLLRLIPFLLFLGNIVSAFTQTATTQRGVLDTTAKPLTPGQPGPHYALVIGINDYRYLTRLNTAVNDANDVATTLRERYGFETKVLLNATRDQILVALDNYRRTLPEDANLLIYYAGHGYYDPDMEKAYWAPVEAQKDTYADWIIADEITSRARAIPARHILVVSDSCYSGMIAATREDSPTMTPVNRSLYLDKMLRKKSRDVMSSGGNEPVIDVFAAGHSVFTYALLQGLKENEWDVFSANELYSRFVRVQVAGKSDQVPQYNVIRDSGDDFGDFVFWRAKVATPVPPKPSPVQLKIQEAMNLYRKPDLESSCDAFQHIDQSSPELSDYRNQMNVACNWKTRNYRLEEQSYTDGIQHFRQREFNAAQNEFNEAVDVGKQLKKPKHLKDSAKYLKWISDEGIFNEGVQLFNQGQDQNAAVKFKQVIQDEAPVPGVLEEGPELKNAQLYLTFIEGRRLYGEGIVKPFNLNKLRGAKANFEKVIQAGFPNVYEAQTKLRRINGILNAVPPQKRPSSSQFRRAVYENC